MSSATTPVTHEELRNAVGTAELGLKLDIGNLRAEMDQRFDKVEANALRMEQNMYALFATLFAHLGIATPELLDTPQ